MKKRIGFLTRGELGYRVLNDLITIPDIEIPFVITCRHSAEVGRSPEDFQRIAEKIHTPYYYTNKINTDKWLEFFKSMDLDLVLAMLWVNTIGEPLIKTARYGFLNLHGGMLPRYRGNACANWAILNNERYHGITAHLMNGGTLDDGPIIVQNKYEIKPDTSIKELMDLNTSEGAKMILESVDELFSKKNKLLPQNEEESMYCYPRLPRDGEINWLMPASEIEKLVRVAGDPYPGAYTFFSDVMDNKKIKKLVIKKAYVESHKMDFCAVAGHLLRLENGKKWAVVCGDNRLLILELLLIGKKEYHPSEFFKTVRQRMGLDTETLLLHLNKIIEIDIDSL